MFLIGDSLKMRKHYYAIIPSRYGSSRFPGKPLAIIKDKPMIQWVYESVKKVELIDEVYIATDDSRIYNVVVGFGGKAIMTSDKHTCGTDRLAECVEILNIPEQDVVLNIQGDEPLINREMILDLISCFSADDVYMGTLMKEIEEIDEFDNPNVVKVITDNSDYAIYFSRYCIPYERDKKRTKHFKHIGVYGYTAKFLMTFSRMGKSSLELSESLEQLRVIQNGFRIKVKETKYQTIGVDVPEQIALVEKRIEELYG